LVAIKSAEIPCGTKPVFAATCGSIGQAPPEENKGTRDIDSTPPPTTRSAWPDMICAAAWLQASSPDAQKRLTVTPGTLIA
jgi:hypothetical protein